MKAFIRIFAMSFAVLLVCAMIGGCSLSRNYIRAVDAQNSEITGSYTVYLFGANHYNDIATVAILAPADGQYRFEIYAPDWAYRTVKGVPGKDAVAMADSFVRWHPSFLRTQTAKILAPDGKVIGFEIRPLYMSTTFGKEDVMYIDYVLKENNIIEVHIHLDYDIEKKFSSGDGKEDSDN